MRNVCVLLLFCFSTLVYSQVITEEEFKFMVDSAQENCMGAHESIVRLTNEDFAKSVWGKKVRFNEANIVRFFSHPSGEKVTAGVDVISSDRKNWIFSHDQQAAADLFTENGVPVTQSYNTLWIKANQALLFAENNRRNIKSL